MPRQAIDPDLFSPDTREFIGLLDRHRVRYLLVGGVAVIYYGHVRTTGDVDFFYDAARENAARLFAALAEFWGGTVPDIDGAEELTREGMVFQFGVPPNRIDLVNVIDGVSFAEAWPGRVVRSMAAGDETCEVSLIGLADLVRNKQASGRPTDLEDMEFLQQQEPD